MTFKELYFRGEIPFEEIDTYTSRWNFSDETCTLATYLGLNGEEEDVWISQSDEALEDLLEAEKKAYQSCRTKLIFTDLDATLLSDDKSVSEGNRKAINDAIAAGHKVILASGRATSSTLRIADDLGLNIPGCYVIGFNGGTIYDCGEKRLLLDRTIPYDLVDLVEKEAAADHIYVQTYQDDLVLSTVDSEDFAYYIKNSSMQGKVVEHYTDFLTKEPNKMLMIDRNTQAPILTWAERMKPQFEGLIDCMFSSQFYFEIVPCGVSKGNAIHFLANYLNIPMDNTIALGDSENDLSMLEAAHFAVSMCNGTEAVKKAADYITEADNNHDGFAEAIRKFVL